MQTIYQKLFAAGVPLDNHESDLYAKATPDARRIVQEHYAGQDHIVKTFISQIDQGLWFDLPFAFDPFWTARGFRV